MCEEKKEVPANEAGQFELSKSLEILSRDDNSKRHVGSWENLSEADRIFLDKKRLEIEKNILLGENVYYGAIGHAPGGKFIHHPYNPPQEEAGIDPMFLDSYDEFSVPEQSSI